MRHTQATGPPPPKDRRSREGPWLHRRGNRGPGLPTAAPHTPSSQDDEAGSCHPATSEPTSPQSSQSQQAAPPRYPGPQAPAGGEAQLARPGPSGAPRHEPFCTSSPAGNMLATPPTLMPRSGGPKHRATSGVPGWLASPQKKGPHWRGQPHPRPRCPCLLGLRYGHARENAIHSQATGAIPLTRGPQPLGPTLGTQLPQTGRALPRPRPRSHSLPGPRPHSHGFPGPRAHPYGRPHQPHPPPPDAKHSPTLGTFSLPPPQPCDCCCSKTAPGHTRPPTGLCALYTLLTLPRAQPPRRPRKIHRTPCPPRSTDRSPGRTLPAMSGYLQALSPTS